MTKALDNVQRVGNMNAIAFDAKKFGVVAKERLEIITGHTIGSHLIFKDYGSKKKPVFSMIAILSNILNALSIYIL